MFEAMVKNKPKDEGKWKDGKTKRSGAKNTKSEDPREWSHPPLTVETRHGVKQIVLNKYYFSPVLKTKTKGIFLRTFILPVLLHGAHAWVLDSRREGMLRKAWRWMCRMAMKKPNRYRLKTDHHWQL